MINIINMPLAAKGPGLSCVVLPKSNSQEFHSIFKLYYIWNVEKKKCPFLCSIIYWPDFERVLNLFHWAGDISYQWKLMNMYLLYTGSDS